MDVCVRACELVRRAISAKPTRAQPTKGTLRTFIRYNIKCHLISANSLHEQITAPGHRDDDDDGAADVCAASPPPMTRTVRASFYLMN